MRLLFKNIGIGMVIKSKEELKKEERQIAKLKVEKVLPPGAVPIPTVRKETKEAVTEAEKAARWIAEQFTNALGPSTKYLGPE
ncbi:MAG: hypothetical protein QXT05_01485, partial [Candidatus Bilamarchaeaceae archaeon]